MLIANPFASRVTEQALRAVETALAPAGALETMVTERPGHATEIAAASDADAVVVFGGDGAVNEALNGMRERVPFSALPGGGTSVFARALGLPRDPAAAAAQVADAIVAGRTRRISLGRVDGRRFGFAAGLGFDAEAVRRVDARCRSNEGRRPGDLRFAAELVRLLAEKRFRLEPSLELHGLGRAAAVLVANCDPYTFAGAVPLRVAPQARFELGLDVVAPVRLTARALPRLGGYVVLGRGQESARDVLYAHDVDRIEITCDRPLPLQVDGEDLGDVAHLVVEAEREALTVLV